MRDCGVGAQLALEIGKVGFEGNRLGTTALRHKFRSITAFRFLFYLLLNCGFTENVARFHTVTLNHLVNTIRKNKM